MTKKVALGMSGGVDSSTSAKLLLEQGYEVTGFYLAGLYPGPKQEAAVADVKRVAAHLDITVQVLDLGERPQFLSDYFLSTYRAGKTPNVCAICNRHVKFGFFYQYALASGFDLVATGHYVRLKEQAGEVFLRTAADRHKDQSYFMALVDPTVWRRAIFPVGDYHKPHIRQLAADWGIPVADKAESMEVCFLQNQKIQDFLSSHLESRPGEIVTATGEVIGQHRGLPFYTIGQRKGLHIQPASPATPVYYVKAKDFTTNRLIVAPAGEIQQTTFAIGQPTEQLRQQLAHRPDLTAWRVRLRHQGTLYPLRAVDLTGDRGIVSLAGPVAGISPGQFAVFYAPDPDSPSDWLVRGAAEIDDRSVE